MTEYCFFLEIIFAPWIYLHWDLYQKYLNIQNLNNLFVLTELFSTLDVLDWRIPYIYIYIYGEMVDLVNLTRCGKISGKVDKSKHRQQIQNNILSLFQNLSQSDEVFLKWRRNIILNLLSVFWFIYFFTYFFRHIYIYIYIWRNGRFGESDTMIKISG